MSSVNPFEQNVDIYNKKICSSKTINTNQSSEVSESAQIDTSGSIYSESSDSKQYSNGLSVENDSEIDSNTYNVIKEQLENEIEQKKQALKDKKDDRGWATSLWNGAKELFGGGDKAELKEIEKLEEELKTLEAEPDNLDAVYKSIMGKDLSAEEISKIKNSSSLVSSLDSSTKQAIITELENQYEQIEDSLDSAKSSNGWISGAWDKFKNWTGIGASSNKSETQLDNMKEQLDSLKENPDNLAEVYKNITGKDFTTDELNKFISGETSLVSESKAAESVSKYSEGQKMATDIVADVVSGIAAVGAIAAAPFTGGASLLLAAGVGAGVKVGLKASDCIGNEKTYGLSDLAYDSVTGSINGMFAPISNGLGGAAGTGVAKAFGLEAAENTVKTALKQTAKTVGKEAAEEVLEQGAKQAGKSTISKILAKQGTEYVLKEGAESTLKTTIGKVAAYGTDMVVDGALSGATDGFARALGEGRIEDIPQDTLNGLAGGAVASPLIGGGFRLATKGGSKIGNMIGKSDIGDSVADEVSDKSKSSFLNKAGELKEAASDKLHKAGDKIKNSNAYQKAGELKDAASDKLHKAGDKIKNSNAYQKAGELKDAASDKLHKAGDKIKNSNAYQKAGELKDAAKDKFHQMAEEYNSTRELMAEDGVSFKDLAADKLHQTGDKIKNSKAYQKAGELKDAAKDKLHQAGDKIKNSNAYQKAGELKDAAKDKFHQMAEEYNSTRELMAEDGVSFKDLAADKLHQTGDKIKNSKAYQKAGELKDAAKDKLHQAGDKIKNSNAYQKAGKLKDAAKDKFHQMAEEYNSTRELMAEDGVSFKDLAADKLHQTGDKIKNSTAYQKAGELKNAASDKLHQAGDKIKNSNAYQKAGELKHAASDKLHQAGDKIKNSNAYQKAGELKDAAKDKLHQAGDKIKNSTAYQKAGELKHAASDKLHQAGDKIKNSNAYQKAGELKDAASDKLHQAGDKIKNSNAYQKAGELKHAASDKLHQAGDKIKNSTAYQKAGELKDSMKTSIKSKLKETKVGKKLVQDYKIAKSNFMNIPQNNSVDAQLVQDLAQFAKKAQEFLDSSNTSLNNHFTNFENTFSNLTTSVDDVIGDISSIRNKILVSSSEKSAMVKELLEEIRAGKDVSPKIIELIDKGIDLTDLFDENLLKVTTDLEDKLGKVSTYSQEYNKSVENLMEILSERTDEATGLANETINVIKKVPDTNAFKQLGDLPDRTKIFATKIQEDISSLKSKSEAAKAKILGGNIEEGLQDLEKYYDEVEVFQSKLEQASIDAQTTAERSGFIETISTLKDRIQSKLNSQGFSSMSKTAQTQSIIEESNIAFSKFIQTMSSDENLPPQVQSFFKEFTSNCTVTRDLAEAQKFADELYGAGKYTLKKSFGAGTVGETYLVTDAEGKEFVMKMLKKGVSEEKFEADRAMFTKYIEEFISDEADKEYKLKLINGLFDSWEKELDYGLEAAGAKNMLDGAKRFNVAQTVEIGTKEGRNISLVMEKADGVGLDTLLDLLKFKNENPTDYMTKSILNDEGKELNPWIKNKKLIEQNSWIKDTESYREALPVAYQKAQNEQAMFLSKKGIKTVHADPHGGNVFVDFDTKTKTPKITYIDTGNVVQRTNSEVLSDISLSLNMLIGNSEGIAHSLIQGATLPAGATQEEMAKKMADLLDERLYKAGINLKDVNYTQSTINNIMKELNIIPDAGNSNLMKATLQRIKTSREIFSVTGTEANKAIDIKDMLKGIAQSFKTNPKETYKTIKPIIKWAYKNKDQTLITFFQMMLKNSDFENIN